MLFLSARNFERIKWNTKKVLLNFEFLLFTTILVNKNLGRLLILLKMIAFTEFRNE